MINIVTIQGRLTRDPETRHTQSGTAVTSFALANESGFGDNKSTLFIDCTAWKGTGETISKYCPKGSMLIVTGALKCRDWTDKEGKKRKSYEINVSDFGFCESKSSAPRADPEYKQPEFTELTGEDSDLPY